MDNVFTEYHPQLAKTSRLGCPAPPGGCRARAHMNWLSSVAEAATSAVSTIQQTIETERKEFMEEYNTVSGGDATPSKAAASSAAKAEGGAESALQNLRRVGWAMLNPLEHQDSLKAEVARPAVVMLPWEALGLSERVRERMRALSQAPAAALPAHHCPLTAHRAPLTHHAQLATRLRRPTACCRSPPSSCRRRPTSASTF